MDLNEVRVFASLRRDARRAVGLVANDQVELREAEPLRLNHDVDRLIGREQNGHPVGRGFAAVHPREELLAIRCRWFGQIDGGLVLSVVVCPSSSDPDIGTDRERPDADLGLRHPLPQALRQELNAWHKEEHSPPTAHLLLGDLQAREGLAGTAGHDQLSAIVLGEALDHIRECVTLMRSELLGSGIANLLRSFDPPVGPIDCWVIEPGNVDALNLPLQRMLSVSTPPIGGIEDVAIRELVIGPIRD